MDNLELCRAAFENWATSFFGAVRIGRVDVYYSATEVQNAWHMWQAAWHACESQDALDAARYRFLRDMQCNHFYLTRNSEHAPNYMTATDWIDQADQGEFDDVPADELARMKETNTIWCLQVYPRTPVSFWTTCGATLDAAVDTAIAADSDKAC